VTAPGREDVDGVVLLDKPTGLTSNAALQRVRRLYRAASGGHAGTLDPLASGLLPVALGQAAKFSQGLLEADKEYLASVRLGVRTTTGDAEGEVIARLPVPPLGEDRLEAALAGFRGEIDQVPPMHSALKRDGRPLYEYARRGETVERAPRRIAIYRLDLIAVAEDRVELRVRCSKGTYVRTLAEDIGSALGCGAHLAGLRRTAVGGFRVEDAVGLAALEEGGPDLLWTALRPVDILVEPLPRIDLDADASERLRHGQSVAAPGALPAPAGLLRAYGPEGLFLGVVQADDGRVRPHRLMRTA